MRSAQKHYAQKLNYNISRPTRYIRTVTEFNFFLQPYTREYYNTAFSGAYHQDSSDCISYKPPKHRLYTGRSLQPHLVQAFGHSQQDQQLNIIPKGAEHQ